MTDTTAPTCTIRTIAETAVNTATKAIADHWGKALATALSAFVAAAITFWFTPRQVAAPVAPKIQYVNTIPAGLEARVSSLEEVAKRIEGKIDDMKPRARGKKK
jgi:hypothetical protein